MKKLKKMAFTPENGLTNTSEWEHIHNSNMDLELDLDPELTPHTYTQKFYNQFIVWLVIAEVRCFSAYFLLLPIGLKK